MPHIYGKEFEFEKLKEVLDPKRQSYVTATMVVNYLETDARQRVIIELGNRGIFDEVAFKPAKLGIILLITAMVVPMLWIGQEFGEHKLTITATYQSFPWRFLRCPYPWR